MMFHITLEFDDSDWVVAECPALPGCISQGKNEQEAIANIKEAIKAWLWAEDQKSVENLKSSGEAPILVSI